MGLFSFLKKEKEPRCAWCGNPIRTPAYTKYTGHKKFYFCSETCKKRFRKAGKTRGTQRRCPSCALRP